MPTLRRIWSWTRWTETTSRSVPPRLDGTAMWSIGTFPISSTFCVVSGFWPGIFWHACLIMICVAGSYQTRQQYLNGVRDGRDELVDEILDTWRDRDISPVEFLLRELHLTDLTDEARRQVRRTHRDTP
jgi:hypothetical protein